MHSAELNVPQNHVYLFKPQLQRQNSTGQKVVLPLLYNITVEEIKEQYPQLTDFQARVVSPTDRVEDVVIDFARILIRALKSEKE